MNRNGTQSGLHRSPAAAGQLNAVRTLMRRAEPLGLRADKKRTGSLSGRDDAALPVPTIGQGEYAHISAPVHPFLARIQREARRAIRTKIPLSIVMFRIDGARRSKAAMMKRLVETVRGNRRETDIPALFGSDLVAIMLLDTGNEGAHVFMHKILAQTGDLPVAAIVQTFPDHLFDNLVSGAQELRSADAFLVDHATATIRIDSVSALLTAAKVKWMGILGLALD